MNFHVNMRPRLIGQGPAFTIFAIDLSDEPGRVDCPAEDFIHNLPAPSQKSLVSILLFHAEKGPITNDEKSKELRDGIYEFKNRHKARLLYFYMPGRRTVLTHGFIKSTNMETSRQIERAKQMRESWKETQR